ncbi:MAG: hypothetical protein PWQ88_519 [Candidatus Methanomethylophilaceae archaeon]|jgi:hypothetical protein|nr:hypothetical protein [Candidatus Methanomethylophilaceae archaeon]MDI3541411.1 hypothetical protein [Candidatus Methanomethylophilaceae archaeon]HIJ00847.1 hypothetical protein [Candidatus Methanomethylophilaceae archaeon]
MSQEETVTKKPLTAIAASLIAGILIIINAWWFQAEGIFLFDLSIGSGIFYTIMSTIGLIVALIGGLMYLAPIYTSKLAIAAMVLALCSLPAGGGFALGALAGMVAGWSGLFWDTDLEDVEPLEEE